MKLFSVDKTAAFAWSPGVQGPLLLATGTKAGAMDASFSSATELDFYAVESSMKKVGSTTVNAR
jgi:protein transport protein SEC31